MASLRELFRRELNERSGAELAHARENIKLLRKKQDEFVAIFDPIANLFEASDDRNRLVDKTQEEFDRIIAEMELESKARTNRVARVEIIKRFREIEQLREQIGSRYMQVLAPELDHWYEYYKPRYEDVFGIPIESYAGAPRPSAIAPKASAQTTIGTGERIVNWFRSGWNYVAAAAVASWEYISQIVLPKTNISVPEKGKEKIEDAGAVSNQLDAGNAAEEKHFSMFQSFETEGEGLRRRAKKKLTSGATAVSVALEMKVLNPHQKKIDEMFARFEQLKLDMGKYEGARDRIKQYEAGLNDNFKNELYRGVPGDGLSTQQKYNADVKYVNDPEQMQKLYAAIQQLREDFNHRYETIIDTDKRRELGQWLRIYEYDEQKLFAAMYKADRDLHK